MASLRYFVYVRYLYIFLEDYTFLLIFVVIRNSKFIWISVLIRFFFNQKKNVEWCINSSCFGKSIQIFSNCIANICCYFFLYLHKFLPGYLLFDIQFLLCMRLILSLRTSSLACCNMNPTCTALAFSSQNSIMKGGWKRLK